MINGKNLLLPLLRQLLVVTEGKEDFSGLPVSVQLIRTDTTFDTEGPLYKGYLVRADNWIAGTDKGASVLQTKTDESTPEKYHVCEILPFYFFRNEMHLGFKPFGHISIQKNPSINLEFKIKVGGMEFTPKIGYTGRNSGIRLDLPVQDQNCLAMLLHRSFLGNKTSENQFEPLFLPNHQPQVLAIWIKANGKFHAMTATKNSLSKEFSFSGGFEGQFAWHEPFSMVILIGAEFFMSDNYKGKFPIRLPAFLDTRELTGSDTKGPDYPVEFVSLTNEKRVVPANMDFSGLCSILKDEKVSVLLNDEMLPAVKISSTELQGLFAVRFDAAYTVEEDTDDLVPHQAFKPFSGSYLTSDKGNYKFTFGLKSPSPIGLNLDSFVEIQLTEISPAAIQKKPFLKIPAFVTGSTHQKELTVYRANFMGK